MNDNFNRYVQGFLAVAITFGFFAVIGVLLYKSDIAPPVKDILLVMLGALLASWKEVTGYFFGSSSGTARMREINAQQQDKAITALTPPNQPPEPPPAVVATPAAAKVNSDAVADNTVVSEQSARVRGALMKFVGGAR